MIPVQLWKVDSDGFGIDSIVVYFDDEGNPIGDIDEDVVLVPIPQGLYRPRWGGTEWIEDMSQEEIEELNNQPKELTEIEKLKISQAEQFETILTIIGGM